MFGRCRTAELESLDGQSVPADALDVAGWRRLTRWEVTATVSRTRVQRAARAVPPKPSSGGADAEVVPHSRAMQIGQLSVRWTSELGVVAHRNQVLVVNYRGAIMPALMEATEDIQRSVLALNGNTCLMLCVVENGLPLPGDDARLNITNHFKRVSDKNTAFATVLLGDGFWAGAARSILSGFTLVVRTPCPNGTFANIEGGARFLATQLGSGHAVDVDGLVSDVEAMRAAAQRGQLRAF